MKVLRKHIKRLVNYAEAGDGNKIREELKRIVPEYRPEDGGRRTDDGEQKCMWPSAYSADGTKVIYNWKFRL